MNGIGEIKIGAVIVECGRLYRVFKVRQEKFNGKSEKVMYYKPFFDDPTQNGLVCSIPVSSIEGANIRIPSTKKEIGQVMTDLKRQVRLRNILDVKDAKTVVNGNDITETVTIIKKFWAEKRKRDSGKLPKSKSDILESAIDQVAQEIAYVSQTSIEKAYEKVCTALGN